MTGPNPWLAATENLALDAGVSSNWTCFTLLKAQRGWLCHLQCCSRLLPGSEAEEESFHCNVTYKGTCLGFICTSSIFSRRPLENMHFLHVVGIVTVGEEKKICTVSENFLRMCESTEVSVSTALNPVRILASICCSKEVSFYISTSLFFFQKQFFLQWCYSGGLEKWIWMRCSVYADKNYNKYFNFFLETVILMKVKVIVLFKKEYLNLICSITASHHY